MSALDVTGQPVVLQSLGAVSVDFTGAGGVRYNLAPGKKATLTIQTDPSNPYSGSVPMWWYDTSRGLWIEEGQGTVQNGVATAQVSHFTVWNFDMKYSDPACVRIMADTNWYYSYLAAHNWQPPKLRLLCRRPGPASSIWTSTSKASTSSTTWRPTSTCRSTSATRR